MTNAELADEIEIMIRDRDDIELGRDHWHQIITALRQEPDLKAAYFEGYEDALKDLQPSSDKVLVRKDVVEFLRGAAPLDGHWFGEKPLELKAFWWRKYLSEAEGHHE